MDPDQLASDCNKTDQSSFVYKRLIGHSTLLISELWLTGYLSLLELSEQCIFSRDAGMKYMVGNDWLDLFEVIVVRARKPKFFNEATR